MTNIDPRYVEMIHRDLDGELAETDRVELDAFLARTPEARNLREAFCSMSSILDRVGEVDPPAGLKHAVLASIAPRQADPSPVRNGWFEWIRETFVVSGPMVRYGAMAAVLLVAAVSYTWFEQGAGRVDRIEAVGTMAPPTETRRILVESAGVQGSIVVHRIATGVTFTVELATPELVETLVEVAPDLTFSAFEAREGSSSQSSRDHGIVVEGRASHAFSLAFDTPRNVTSTVLFSFVVDGAVIESVSVDFGAAR